MPGDALIAGVESTREVWTGASLADGVEALVDAIRSESWVDGLIAGAAFGVEVVATVMDPFSALLANGLGWAMEYFEPLRQMLDELTGMPDVIASHAATWTNMAVELYSMAEDLRSSLSRDLPDWRGLASAAYQNMMSSNVEALGGLGAVSAAMTLATEAAGNLVSFTRAGPLRSRSGAR